jgi:hypothetical protein
MGYAVSMLAPGIAAAMVLLAAVPAQSVGPDACIGGIGDNRVE